MKKCLVLFLIILVNISFAQNFLDDRIREHYYQLLLGKWQERANWQDSHRLKAQMGNLTLMQQNCWRVPLTLHLTRSLKKQSMK
jgi:hypothetical protein